MYLTLYAYSETKAKATIHQELSLVATHYTNIRQLQNLKSGLMDL